MIQFKILKVFAIVIFAKEAICDGLTVQLKEPNATVQGHKLETYTGKKYWAFQEIPYSLPPVDDRRFKVPKAHTGWEGVLEATKNTKICMQPMESNPHNLEVTEDCLYLNVYTPVEPGTTDQDTERAVLIWFHGGGFQTGSGVIQQWNPQFFIEQDIVVVTLNYRLGPFGFLWPGDSNIPGNLGLRDQNMAYKWVFENIELFGGDNNRICLGGQGAGAASVSYQWIQADVKRTYYYCGIMQSGSSVSPHYYQSDPERNAFALGAVLKEGFNSTEVKDLKKILTKADAQDILEAGLELQASAAQTPGYYKDSLWLPVVEEYVDGAFLGRQQLHSWTYGWVKLMPTLIGFTSEERIAAAMEDDIMQVAIDYDNDNSLLLSPKLGMSQEHREERGPKLKALYTTDDFQNNMTGLIRYLSDEVSTPLLKQAYNQSWYSISWLYQFSYKGELGGMTNINEYEGAGTVAHGEELKYLWDDGTNSDPNQYSEEDRRMHETLITLWSNFIKQCDPTPVNNTLQQDITWPKIEDETLHYLDIDSTLTIQKHTPRDFFHVNHIIEKYLEDPITVF